ncbi:MULTISPECIES: metallophosphoesterase [Pseudomonas]|nr:MULTISPECIES: metallophosphoesterase [Pseudomonas]|tara:strand:- start:2280 stop:2966 length:687 start_codon:yes stop_codon:yes gene_type:complete
MQNRLVTHKILATNTVGDDWICSDIHGQIDILQSMLLEIDFDPKVDRLIFVGDLIDRGPDSLKALNFVLNSPQYYSVIGNHELLFWASYRDSKLVNKRRGLGGEWADSLSRAEHQRLMQEIERQFPLAISLQTSQGVIGIVHAQSPFDSWRKWKTEPFSSELAKKCTWDWSKSRAGGAMVSEVDVVVSGHIGRNTLIRGNQIWIDTLDTTGRPTILSACDLIGMVSQR